MDKTTGRRHQGETAITVTMHAKVINSYFIFHQEHSRYILFTLQLSLSVARFGVEQSKQQIKRKT